MILPMAWLMRCMDARVDETATLALEGSQDHKMVSSVLRRLVGPDERRGPAYNRDALRLTPVRKVTLEQWQGKLGGKQQDAATQKTTCGNNIAKEGTAGPSLVLGGKPYLRGERSLPLERLAGNLRRKECEKQLHRLKERSPQWRRWRWW